jgi:hypothetical protein
MSRTTSASAQALSDSEDRARQRAQEAVQEALDRRDNGGDSATSTDS